MAEPLVFRRLLYVSQDMKAGDVFTPKSLRAVRLGLGLPSKYYDILLRQTIKQDAKKGTSVNWNLLKANACS